MSDPQQSDKNGAAPRMARAYRQAMADMDALPSPQTTIAVVRTALAPILAEAEKIERELAQQTNFKYLANQRADKLDAELNSLKSSRSAASDSDAAARVRSFLDVLDKVNPQHRDTLLTTGAATPLCFSDLRALVSHEQGTAVIVPGKGQAGCCGEWNSAEGRCLDCPVPQADGYAVKLPDSTSAPRGYWFVGCYTERQMADQVARKVSAGAVVVPIFFAPPSAASASGTLTPEELQRLIDFHDNAAAGAEAQDYFDSSQYHDSRSKHFKAMLDET